MKVNSPGSLALLLTVILVVLLLPLLFAISFWKMNQPVAAIAVMLTILFSCFFIIRYLLKQCLKINLLHFYDQLVKLRQGKNIRPVNGLITPAMLDTIKTDMQDWAHSRSKEIEQLKLQENYRKEFIGNVSHELKTPIFNIQGYILTLLEGGLDDPKINRDYLQRAERSVERMISIVEELETITRLESGQMNLEPDAFDLSRLVRDVVESEELKASARHITLRIHKSLEKPVMVYADRDKIRQVLTNLVVNSIKYGVVQGFTEIRCHDKEEELTVEVEDNGLGIEPKHQPRLFERFYRVDKSRSREMGGSGLGLAIVKHIIEAHQQQISVRSKLGEGSVFSFTLRKA